MKTSLSPAAISMFFSKGLQWSRSDYPRHMLSCVQPLSRYAPPSHRLLYLDNVRMNHIKMWFTAISLHKQQRCAHAADVT